MHDRGGKEHQSHREVADGSKVVGLVERLKPRLLIVALAMPGLNGLEITRRVCQQSPATAVIMLSMYSRDQYVIQALRNGACGYVMTQAKPVELIRAIRKAAAGSRYLSEPLSQPNGDLAAPGKERGARRRRDTDASRARGASTRLGGLQQHAHRKLLEHQSSHRRVTPRERHAQATVQKHRTSDPLRSRACRTAALDVTPHPSRAPIARKSVPRDRPALDSPLSLLDALRCLRTLYATRNRGPGGPRRTDRRSV